MKLTTILIVFALTQTSGQIGGPNEITLDATPGNQFVLYTITYYDSSQNVNSKDVWLAMDKVQHFTFSFLWMLAAQYVSVNKFGLTEKEGYPISLTTGVIIGVLKELHDKKKPDSHFSKRDLIVDFLGLLTASTIILTGLQ